MRSRGVGAASVVLASVVAVAACQGPSGTAGSTTTSRPPSVERPAEPDAPATTRDLEVPAAVTSAAGQVATLPATRTKEFALLGVTWDQGDDDADVRAEVRVRTDEGWSDWEQLEVDHESDEGGRAGTEPWWVESADEVSARVTTSAGTAPTGVRVVTVDPGDDPTPTTDASPAFYSLDSDSQVVTVADGKPTFTPRPKILTRTSWKAKGAKGCDDPPKYPQYGTTTEGVLLHHTAGSNSYSKKQSASIVRGIQSFHMKGRGWCDIGYNFLIDKYGQIFAGRAGGANRQVRGSHAGISKVNEQTMGVSLMGNLDKRRPSTAMKNATVKLIGWRMGTTYLPVSGSYKISGKKLGHIAGHRNVVSTACPGKYGYSWLKAKGGLRDRVKAYTSKYSSAIKTAASKLSTSVKGVVVIGEEGDATSRLTVFSKLDFYWLKGVGAFPVAGNARKAYSSVKGTAGVLGYPTSSMTKTTVSKVAVQQFQRGGIWQVSTAYYVLSGTTYQAYVSRGGEVGALGAPTSGLVTLSPTTTRTTFVNGKIEATEGQEPVVTINGEVQRSPQPDATPGPEVTPGPTPTPDATTPDTSSDQQVAPVSWTPPFAGRRGWETLTG